MIARQNLFIAVILAATLSFFCQTSKGTVNFGGERGKMS